ncbi:hypothetical protein ISE1_2929 [plant metagenome]|uniref:Uncharacterized protein n=1 Tax=plant metagenome TaxID=1297885 RepID=A0A484U0J7_9ZZZZ
MDAQLFHTVLQSAMVAWIAKGQALDPRLDPSPGIEIT